MTGEQQPENQPKSEEERQDTAAEIAREAVNDPQEQQALERASWQVFGENN